MELEAWESLAHSASATWNGMLVERRIGNRTDARKLGVVAIVKHGRGEQDVERRLDATVQIIVNSYHMLPRASSPYHALSLYPTPSGTTHA